MDIPTCCGEPMLVQADGVFECDICAETKTEDDLQSDAERAFEREQARLMSDPPESYESLQAKARLLK